MNFKTDFSLNQQELLQQLDISIENREYSKAEIKNCFNTITEHIMSKSSKNGDIANERMKYANIIDILQKYE